jgi:5-methylcytosine-specific restriction protein B
MKKKLDLQGRPIYKVSMGTFCRTRRGRELLSQLQERHWLSVNEYCADGQGELFKNGLQPGDFVYACAASTQLLGIYRIVGPWQDSPDELIPDIDGEGWGYRQAELIAKPTRVDVRDLKDEQSWWAPSGYRTVAKISDLRTANRVLFGPYFDLTIMSNTPEEVARKAAAFAAKFPNPNIILYGPPGTGKTHSTLSLAYELLTGNQPATYADAQQLFQEELGKRIEFVTFHQNFTYEDFVQGIKPEVNKQDELVFRQKNGVFYEIARRARDEYNQQDQPDRPGRVPFDVVFNQLVQPLEERDEEVAVKMKTADYAFHLTALNDTYLRFRRHENQTESNLKIETLRGLYEETIGYKQGGLQLYYEYVVNRLVELADEIKREGPGTYAQADLLLPGGDESALPRNYVLIIDEINRANISKVFGELITLIERDKRLGGDNPLSVTLPTGEARFNVPANLYIIGTMNTADKSIALLDIALRRRFEFQALYPVYQLDGQRFAHADVFQKLNQRIIKLKSRDFQIGHAYFMKDTEPLADILDKKVIPLLYEYFLNDDKKVEEAFKETGIQVHHDANTGLLRYGPAV